MDLPTLKHHRGIVKGSLTKTLNYLNSVDKATLTIIILKNRRLLSEQHFRRFEELQQQIEESLKDSEAELLPQISERDDVEAKYLDIVSVIDSFIDELSPPPASNPPPHRTSFSHTHHAPTPSLRLPSIDLPKFTGKYEEWTSFMDLFETTIHANGTLGDVEKLQYLKGLVTGEAASVIKNLPTTSANYSEAWTLLKSRYNNTREIVYTQMRRLFNIYTVKNATSSSIQQLLDSTKECVRALNSLGQPTDQWDTPIVYMTVEKLDSETRKQWALSLVGTDLPKYNDLCTFLEQHIRGLHACGSIGKTTSFNDKKTTISHYSSTNSTTQSQLCVLCQSAHSIFKCNKFLMMTVNDRIDCVKSNYLCFNCLRPNHKTVDCKSSSKCKTCNRQHHTMLHHNKNAASEACTSSSEKAASAGTSRGASARQILHGQREDNDVLLCTANVRAKTSGNDWVNLRILLDGGSQGTLITKRCVKRLGLRRLKDKLKILGVGSALAGYSTGKVMCRLHSNVNSEFIDVAALIMEEITQPLPNFPCRKDWDYLQGLRLADESYYEEGSIDILLGQEYYMEILLEGCIRGNGVGPSAINTIFGWAVGGRIPNQQQQSLLIHHIKCDTATDNIVKRFWELEEVPKPKFLTSEERQCEEHFVRTFKRDENGRFLLELPLNSNIKNLGHSRDIAIRRLKQVERRLARQPQYRDEYNKVMREAIKLKHMVRVPRGEDIEVLGKTNYLCHHFVLKPDSTTTKFRVVYDASAATSTGISLNDCLLVGPTFQNDIFTLLLKFRLRRVAFKADYEKMFKQFSIIVPHANLQRIVWRENESDDFEDYMLATVTYGTGSASFQSTRCLKQLAIENQLTFPLAAEKLMEETYVDDVIGSCDTTEETIKVVKQLDEVSASACLSLRKWSTSDANVREQIPEEKRETSAITFEKDSNVKALGVVWNQYQDLFTFGKIDMPKDSKLTKRKVLSQLAKVFDPLGLIAPVTVTGKIFMQALWKDKLQWDEPLSLPLCSQWKDYCEQLENIDSIKIRRWIQRDNTKSVQLCGFCDSSERAYGAVIYLRCEIDDGTYSAFMVAAKSRVAPAKNVTLPRLELCSAVQLSQLVLAVKEALKLKCDILAWTDSMIVLHWLASHPGRWPTFVANRVASIQDVVPSQQWNHVRSEENPADLVSRGVSAMELSPSSIWWHGPEWLSTPELPSPAVLSEVSKTDLEERKPKTVVHLHVTMNTTLIDKFSSFFQMKRVIAYVLRLKRFKKDRVTGPLTTSELQEALTVIIRMVQRTYFPSEIQTLMSGSKLPATHKLLSLAPFLDSDGIMRVGGRLQGAALSTNQKHNAIIPGASQFANVLILDAHLRNLHGGPKLVLSYLRNNYWITNGKNCIRYLLRKCVICRRQRAETMSQLMGSLPSSRVTPGRAFLHTGCDYAGPFHLKVMKDGRGKKLFKGYFCIFVCMATKAVHLEAVSDMTTEAFIEALKRFVSRRGVPAAIYSDCGTNFVGADKELREMLKDELRNKTVATELSRDGIEWRFNPPASPHHGGLWEAGVKSVKFHLRRIMDQRSITFEEFTTILCQVEACLNSRPLTAMSSDPEDFDVLTPGHFLVGHALTALPQSDMTEINMNRLSRWQYTQQCFQNFWKRWHAEYLTTLQQRYKWKCKRDNLKVGDLVLIHEQNLPPLKWRMGRVLKLHEGQDGLVRVVTLKTMSGELKRPIVKLTPLLSNDE